ncbi:MAG: hypothetical protein AAFX90_13525 [Pseudomonadota bacterium]
MIMHHCDKNLPKPQRFCRGLLAGLLSPLGATLLGLLRWLAIMMRTMAIGAYIQGMEEKAVCEGRGWETILKKIREENPVKSQQPGDWQSSVHSPCSPML